MTQKSSGGPGSRGGEKYKGSRVPIDVRSLARSHTKTVITTLSNIMRDEKIPAMSRVAAAKILLDRGWGRPSETHHIDVNGEGASLMRVVNEIVHVHETREQIEFRDQTPLLELVPEDTDGNGSKSPH
jgi:hypothetical protein